MSNLFDLIKYNKFAIIVKIFIVLFYTYIIMDYRNKYLHYKNEYINLKNEINKKQKKKDQPVLKGGVNSPKISSTKLTLDELSYMLSKEDFDLFKKKNYENAYTFGTLSQEGLHDILLKSKEYNKNLKNPTFLDIGSGDGRIVIWAIKEGIKRSLGVELSKSRYELSNQYKERLNKDEQDKIEFYNDDILNFDVKNNDIDIIYISSLCMPQHLLHKITEKLSKETKKGTLIFSSSPLIKTMTPRPTPLVNDKNLKYIGELDVKQSWKNESNINIYKTI